MKIEIEKRIEKQTSFVEVNTVFFAAKHPSIKSLPQLFDLMKSYKFHTLEIGIGGSHIWVKEKHGNPVWNDRLMLITE